jgi:hypothetical protein
MPATGAVSSMTRFRSTAQISARMLLGIRVGSFPALTRNTRPCAVASDRGQEGLGPPRLARAAILHVRHDADDFERLILQPSST